MSKSIKDREHRKNKEKDIKEKIGLFNLIPDHCLTCLEPFDKKNKEQVQTWFVIVKEEKRVVRLYCPICFQKAQDIIKDFKERKQNELNNSGGTDKI